MIDPTPSRTTGTFHEEETLYIVNFGPESPRERVSKTFYNEDKANEFFQLKQRNGFHVDAYKEVRKITRTVSKL